jgi:hypothetical protein
MTFVSVNPQGLLFCSPANENTGFSLSRSYAQMPGSPPVTGLNALLFTIARARHGYMIGNRFDLFLDFKEKFPHSSSQLDTHND